MTSFESNNASLTPNKRKSGRRRNRGSPKKKGVDPSSFSTPPKPVKSSNSTEQNKIAPNPEDLLPEASALTERKQEASLPPNSSPPPATKSLVGNPPSPPTPPRPPPSPSPDVFAPSKDLLDLAITGKSLRPALDSPKASGIMLDRAQFSPGMLFDSSYSYSGAQLSPSQTAAFLAAQLGGDRPVHCSPVRQPRRAVKKRGTLASIVEGDEPPSKPQFPAAEEASVLALRDLQERESTPAKRRPNEKEEKGSSDELERAELEETKTAFEDEEIEPFPWQDMAGDSDMDYDSDAPISPESPLSIHTMGRGEDSCTEDDYSKFAIAADEEPLAAVDVHITPRGRRVPMFSHTPEWTEMMKLNEAKMEALAQIGPVIFEIPDDPPELEVAELAPEPVVPQEAAREPPSPPPVAPDLLPEVPELLPMMTSPTLSDALEDFDHLAFEGDEDTLPDQSIVDPDVLPSQLPPLPASPILSMSLQSPEAGDDPCTPAPSTPWEGFFTPPPMTGPFVSSQLTPVAFSPPSNPRILWRITAPSLAAAPNTPCPPSTSASPSPSSSPSKLRAGADGPETPAEETPQKSLTSSSAECSPSASPLPNGLRFVMPDITPTVPKKTRRRNPRRSPPTPATPLSPIKRVDPEQLEGGVEELEEECDINFVFPDVSAEIQTGSDRYFMAMRALASGLGTDTSLHAAMQTPLKERKPLDTADRPGEDEGEGEARDGDNNGVTSDAQFPLRARLLADLELSRQCTTPSESSVMSSVFGTITPLSPLIRPTRAISSPQSLSPSLGSRSVSTPGFDKHLLAKKVAALERELSVTRSTTEQLAQAFGEAQTKLRASEKARRQEAQMLRTIRSTLDGLPPATPEGETKASYKHVATPMPK